MGVSSISRQASPPPTALDASSADVSSASSSSSSSSASSAPTSSNSPAGKGFVSPIMQIDSQTGAAVLSFRDPDTGLQDFQSPSRSALEYDRQQRLADVSAHASSGTVKA